VSLEPLALRARDGDRAALDELARAVLGMARKAATVVRTSRALLEEREDAAAQAALDLVLNLRKWDPSKGPFAPWARRRLKFRAIDHGRRAGRTEDFMAAEGLAPTVQDPRQLRLVEIEPIVAARLVSLWQSRRSERLAMFGLRHAREFGLWGAAANGWKEVRKAKVQRPLPGFRLYGGRALERVAVLASATARVGVQPPDGLAETVDGRRLMKLVEEAYQSQAWRN
jgi:DNA-directed RNA polymerase specialized sigma24 family protein